jgi:hypothetical protein
MRLICSYSHVEINRVIANELLERSKLKHTSAPSSTRVRENAAINIKEMPEGSIGIQSVDGLSKVGFDLVEILISLSKLLPRIAKHILHLRYTIAHVKRKSCAIFSPR